jgi:hypothetical protein
MARLALDQRFWAARFGKYQESALLQRPGHGPRRCGHIAGDRRLIHVKRAANCALLNASSIAKGAPMKALASCLTLGAAALASPCHAQVSIDMSRVTCAEYLAMPATQSATFSAWMSGWFNQKSGYVFVDVDAYARNVANVKSWCALNPSQTVMAGLQRATARQ